MPARTVVNFTRDHARRTRSSAPASGLRHHLSGFNEEFNAYFARLEGKDLASLLQQGKSRIFATNLDQTRWLKRNSLLVRFKITPPRQRLRYRYYDARPLSTQSPTIPSASEKASYDVDPFIMKHYLIVLGQFIDLIRQNGGKPIYVITGGLRYGELGRFLQYSLQRR